MSSMNEFNLIDIEIRKLELQPGLVQSHLDYFFIYPVLHSNKPSIEVFY